MKFNIEPFNRFIYRIPALNVEELMTLGSVDAYDRNLKKLLSNKEFQEALYLASPAFLDEVLKFIDNDDYAEKNSKRMISFRTTALKYLNRICTRPTPFGVFAGCGVGNVDGESIQVTPRSENRINRKVRFDMEFLELVKEGILKNPEDRRLFRFYTNNTVYELSDEYRYIAYNNTQKKRNHTLSSIMKTPYLSWILEQSKKGLTYQEILKFLLDSNIAKDSAIEYIDDLIDSKILISELEPHIISDSSYEYRLINTLESKGSLLSAKQKNTLSTLKSAVRDLESLNTTTLVYSYLLQIENSLKTIIDKKVKNYFQIDSEMLHSHSNLPKKTVWDIKKSMKVFLQLTSLSNQNNEIISFKNSFKERYGSKSVRLVELLDPELGLSYGQFSDNQLYPCPIIDDIPISKRKSDSDLLVWNNKVHTMLFNKILNALKTHDHVKIEVQDLESYSFDQSHIPATITAFLQLIPDQNNEYLIHLKNWGSDSATTILGRFTSLSPEMDELVKDISSFEQKCLPSHKILSEINHLPNAKIGNIISRSKFRKHEIPYVTKSNSNETGLIDINKLYVKLVDGKFKILDIENKRQIIPILSNAHNFKKDSLPIYKFLCDIQNESDQERLYMNLNLGPITTLLDHIPRITHKKTILRLATWKLRKKDFDWLFNTPESKRLDAIKQYLKKNHLPKQFFITSGDNKLLIDFQNIPYPSLLLFSEEIHKYGAIIIEENPYGENFSSVINNEKGNFLHELIVPFKNHSRLEDAKFTDDNNYDSYVTQRKFHPGSEWVYFKIFSGIHTREIIIQQLSPLIDYLKSKGIIQKWFFIKYSDPENHLRLRFKLFKRQQTGVVIESVFKLFEGHLKSKKISRINLDTYEREIERYGGDQLMNQSETIFQIDSEWSLSLLKSINNHPVLRENYWLIALKICDIYMNAFDFGDALKLQFSKRKKEDLSREFNANKIQKRKILNKYKDNEQAINKVINKPQSIFPKKLVEEFEAFEKDLSNFYQSDIQGNSRSLEIRLLVSYIHMSLIRILPSKNRLHEYFIFSIIECHYRIKVGKSKANSKSHV
ncbi:lantibiotic dehydratase [Galbibacter pacificus]|uniref:Lantibiotic dehydratase n=1 Tax=Galbibacter pacificus TaxID=2996052 RepID=A0ABT6FRV9_9FLAO|nr:lantibiotic dehydratase [Galbibacter pacificus]MDG3582877.1 lantibiotic dehydratase [Galbibacter pacificus]MDG3586004.1 lantibiotic dehydratase [Galbibacter pacificus]